MYIYVPEQRDLLDCLVLSQLMDPICWPMRYSLYMKQLMYSYYDSKLTVVNTLPVLIVYTAEYR